jgi:hypothetical protein
VDRAQPQVRRRPHRGRVGYVYVPTTGIDGQSDLVRQMQGQLRKAALIVDERWNSGGQIPTRFIEFLNRPVTNYWARRDGHDWPWPPDAHFGPKCMLINGLSGSGGDAFPFYFKQAGLGKLIGLRTWGGLVGLSGYPLLIDGGDIECPSFAFYEKDGTWGIEGHGVDPDIEVVDDPALMVDGGDPQLDRAIAEMLEELEKSPFQWPRGRRTPIATAWARPEGPVASLVRARPLAIAMPVGIPGGRRRRYPSGVRARSAALRRLAQRAGFARRVDLDTSVVRAVASGALPGRVVQCGRSCPAAALAGPRRHLALRGGSHAECDRFVLARERRRQRDGCRTGSGARRRWSELRVPQHHGRPERRRPGDVVLVNAGTYGDALRLQGNVVGSSGRRSAWTRSRIPTSTRSSRVSSRDWSSCRSAVRCR